MSPARPRLGDRFRLTRHATIPVWYQAYAPSHTVGGEAELEAGTVIVALDANPSERATAFVGYPQDYEALEPAVVPSDVREAEWYAGGYVLVLMFDQIGDLLEEIEPLDPRPTGEALPPPLD